jgi:Polyketide cyclase / dehydrase and lipid transport
LFSIITDIEGLPAWNRAIEKVIERPTKWTPGATWTIQMHPAGPVRWQSVSNLHELDARSLRFTYQTVNADGNPSFTVWAWQLAPTASGVEVSVGWDVHLKTLGRRLLAGPIRRRQLRKEVAASLSALSESATALR